MFSSEIDVDVDKYMLTVDNDLFNTHIVLSDCVNIIHIKIQKKLNNLDEDIEPALVYTSNSHIKILAIE